MTKRQQGGERETSRSTDARELREARREIVRLTRLVARLQSKVKKQVEREDRIEREASPEPSMAAIPEVAALRPDNACEKCGGTDLGTFVTPGGTRLISCRACNKSRPRR